MPVFENTFSLVVMTGTFWKDRIISFLSFDYLTIVNKIYVTLLKIPRHTEVNFEV